MPTSPKPGVLLYVKNLEQVARFYERLLTLAVSRTEEDHIVLESEACQLILHRLPPYIAESIVIQSSPEVREGTPVKWLLPVPSIADARLLASSLGGQVWPVEREWEFMDMRVCDGIDPEGNVFQLRQKVPEYLRASPSTRASLQTIGGVSGDAEHCAPGDAPQVERP